MKNYKKIAKLLLKSTLLFGLLLSLNSCESDVVEEDSLDLQSRLEISSEVNEIGITNSLPLEEVVVWSTDMCYNDSWRVSKHPRMMSDVNGDGKMIS